MYTAAALVMIPTTHMAFFCNISRTRYTSPVTNVNISMYSSIAGKLTYKSLDFYNGGIKKSIVLPQFCRNTSYLCLKFYNFDGIMVFVL